MKKSLILLFLIISSTCFSQKEYLDSLWSVWKDNTQSDTTRLKAMYDFAWDGYLYTQPDSSFYFSKSMLEFAKETGQKEFQTKALNLQFNYYFGKGDFTKAMEKNNEGFKLREELGDKRGMAVGCSNYGILYQVQGDYAKAIDYYTRALKYTEETGNKSGTATALHNIGHLYEEQQDHIKAIEYYSKSLKIREEIQEELGIATSKINIGSLYHNQGEHAKAMEYL